MLDVIIERENSSYGNQESSKESNEEAREEDHQKEVSGPHNKRQNRRGSAQRSLFCLREYAGRLFFSAIAIRLSNKER